MVTFFKYIVWQFFSNWTFLKCPFLFFIKKFEKKYANFTILFFETIKVPKLFYKKNEKNKISKKNDLGTFYVSIFILTHAYKKSSKKYRNI